ncbi:MAG: RNA polymerase sigma factor [Acidobacteria bacterium]|nr:RNA polymerase sigma factor [Acidobacteriota bacterium]
MDADAFRSAVEETKDRAYSLAVHLLRDPEEGRDVVQEAFLRMWQHREPIEAGPPARAWLLRTVHNLAIDRVRARAVRPCSDEDPDSLRSDRDCPERFTSRRELREHVRLALEQLTDRDREVLALREIDGRTYEDIARALDAPLGTAKAILHRARVRLRRRLALQGVRP